MGEYYDQRQEQIRQAEDSYNREPDHIPDMDDYNYCESCGKCMYDFPGPLCETCDDPEEENTVNENSVPWEDQGYKSYNDWLRDQDYYNEIDNSQ